MSQSSKDSGMINRLWGSFIHKFNKHKANVALVFTIIGTAITILDSIFGVNFTPYTDVVARYMISTTFMVIMMIFVLISHVFLHRRVDQIAIALDEIYEEEITNVNETSEEVAKDIATDGGKSDLPARDRQGRFKSKKEGGGNILILILLSGSAGFLIADSLGFDPVGGALIGAALILLYQS